MTRQYRSIPAVLIALIALIALSFGCNKDAEGDKGQEPEGDRRGGPGGGPGGGGPGGDGPGGEGDGPQFPPPGAVKVEPPPAVLTIVGNVMNAFNAKNAAEVKRYFISRQNFNLVSDCDPKDVVDRVMDGSKQAAERAVREGGNATFKGFTEGYLLEVKKGDKPAECRAKADVGLYMARYKWEIGGRMEDGEAHFLRVGSVWYFVKL
ncbi:MAG: hypothetical protein ACI9OJ_000933 [Myxococcota bacterium]|jgi:hypothetical protein